MKKEYKIKFFGVINKLIFIFGKKYYIYILFAYYYGIKLSALLINLFLIIYKKHFNLIIYYKIKILFNNYKKLSYYIYLVLKI